jgi:hypothetical protein
MSTLTNFKGDGPWLGDEVTQSATSAPSFLANGIIDASTEKVAVLGCVWHPTVKTGTINIRKVHFRCGAVTFNAASVLRVSLQNVSATAGPPYQPDGTQDQTADMTTLSANAWNTTGALSADRAVDLSAVNFTDANSRWLAVVFEYQTFTAADSVVISSINTNTSQSHSGLGGAQLLNTGSWAIANTGALGVVALECDDGSYAFIDQALPISAFGNATTANNAAIRAAGVRFRFPVEVKIEAASLWMAIPNICDGTLIIYDSDGSTSLVSVAVDNDAVIATGSRHQVVRFPPITLAANTYYRLAFVPTTTTAATVYYADVNAVGLMDGLVGGQDMHWTQRDSAGVWTETTTRRPHFGLKLSAVHDGTGGGGGLAIPVSGRICA